VEEVGGGCIFEGAAAAFRYCGAEGAGYYDLGGVLVGVLADEV
jgi:hypothetical protein